MKATDIFDEVPKERPDTPLLDAIDSPADLRRLQKSSLAAVARELRAYLLWTVHQTGGHLGAGLGVVELSIALHYLLDTPHDRIVWDVGHQCYPHKILTGRREQMASLRQKGGLKGFPSRDESRYDHFGTGHSSTSISAALGMSVASAVSGEKRHCVAVIGDGAMTAGMAYEALCDAGNRKADLLVILNDNRMSISPNTGGLADYLARAMTNPNYFRLRNRGKHALPQRSFARRAVRKLESTIKSTISPGGLFQDMGFTYSGPIDGNSLDELLPALEALVSQSGPHFLHIITTKGKGLSWAESSPVASHAVAKIGSKAPGPKEEATPSKRLSNRPKYQDIFGDWIVQRAAQDDRLYVITPAMREGSGLVEFEKRFPERYRDVAIAEQHALTLASGMACEPGIKPIVAIYSTFLQRAYDQVVHDLVIQKLDVTLAVDRAGLIGEDGPTHAGHFDISMLRVLPGMTIAAPSDGAETKMLLEFCYQHPGPAAVRYPRGEAVEDLPQEAPKVEMGKARVLKVSSAPQHSAALLAFGPLARCALDVAQAHPDWDLSVCDMRFVKPLDEALILEWAASHAVLITLEDHAVAGGAGSAVSELLQQKLTERFPVVLHLGIPDRIIDQASRPQMLSECGLDATGIAQAVERSLALVKGVAS